MMMDSLALGFSYDDIMGKHSKVVIASRGVHGRLKRGWLRRHPAIMQGCIIFFYKRA
jgi:hypothetical protein